MHLKDKDKVLICALALFFFFISFIGWLMWGGVILIVSLVIAIGLLTTMQLEIYRRTQQQLRRLKQFQEEQQYQEEQTQKIRKQIDMVLNAALCIHEGVNELETKDNLEPKSYQNAFWNTLIKVRQIRPLSIIPPHLIDKYTMNGKIKIEEWYLDDTQGSSKARVYTKEEIDALIEKAKRKEESYYGATDRWFYQALQKFPIDNKEVAIMGSGTPWYESICLSYGGLATTIEYNKVITKDSRLRVLTVDEYDKNPIKFDAAFSISSFEHDGLGRYGDPLNPNGDLEAMTKMKSILKPKGILFLAVPVGMDKVVWNASRGYGRIRLPLLLKGWEVLDTFGFDDSLLDEDYSHKGRVLQPIFVLENRI